jgi:hypothetical protein
VDELLECVVLLQKLDGELSKLVVLLLKGVVELSKGVGALPNAVLGLSKGDRELLKGVDELPNAVREHADVAREVRLASVRPGYAADRTSKRCRDSEEAMTRGFRHR